MKTVPCPNRDKGKCTIPSRTALITHARVTRRSRNQVVGSAPDLDLSGGRMVKVDLPAQPQAVLKALRAPQGRLDQGVHRALRRAYAKTPGARSVVVTCSCGHVFVVDL
jgi:hypothetical protein